MKKLDNWAEQFIQQKRNRNLSAESITTYRCHLKLFLTWYSTRYSLLFPSFITSLKLQEYTSYLLDSGLTAKSINNRLKVINQFIDFMRKNGVRAKSDVRAEMLRCAEPHNKTFLLSEIQTIIENLDMSNSDSVLTVFLLSTGVRSKTVRAIRVQDIDFVGKILELRHLKNRKYLSIPLADPLLDILKKYISINSLHQTDSLFFNRFGSALTRSTIYERVKRYLSSIGIERTGIHIFRYSYAKISVLNGIDAVTLQRLMTHQDVEESSHYVELYSPELRLKQNKYNVLVNTSFMSLS